MSSLIIVKYAGHGLLIFNDSCLPNSSTAFALHSDKAVLYYILAHPRQRITANNIHSLKIILCLL